MVYKINAQQFAMLGGNKEKVIKRLNERLCHPYIEQTSILVEDKQTKARQRIKTDPIRIITDIIIQ